MHQYRFIRWLALLGWMLVLSRPALATRTVFDTWGHFGLSGYCSPNSSCAPYAMPFSVQMGGNSYNSFYVNSNGTVSFSSIAASLALENSHASDGTYTGAPAQTSLAAYGTPIFSPNFLDGHGPLLDLTPGYDGMLPAFTSIGSNSFSVSWFPCSSGYPLNCGQFSMNIVSAAIFNPADPMHNDLQSIILDWGASSCPCASLEERFLAGKQNLLAWMTSNLPVYTMTMTGLTDGFQVDYSYNPAATGQQGVFGFNLPSGFEQTTGPLQNRTYIFDAFGNLTAVPEPATWMTMLLGFALLAFTIRGKRSLQAA